MKNKTLKYTSIRKKLRLDESKWKEEENLAAITHYLQNRQNGAGKLYYSIPEVVDFVSKVEDTDFQYNLPIEWDVPFPPPKNPRFKFVDLFAGIGGIRLAYQNLGGKCVFTSEWNTYAKKTYEANFGEVPFGDITKIHTDQIPDHDILLAGFPCQPFSIAGVSKKNALGRAHGFKDETQGTLFFDIVRILEAKRPKAFMLENVKNLTSHDRGHTFKVIMGSLNELGYNVTAKVLDGKHFVPQHRERIIIVGFNSEVFKGNFEYPVMPNIDHCMEEILLNDVEDKYTLTDHLWKYLQNYALKHKEKGNGFGFGLIKREGISRTMSARYYKDGAEILIPQPGRNPRRLTPREAARLQGFPDNFVIPVSDTQSYKQFGNSVVVPLIQSVGEEIVKKIDFVRIQSKIQHAI